jgi:hypothetical protein
MAINYGQIGQLAGQMPVANEQLASQQRAARDIQMQQMVGAAAPTQATQKVAQQAGTQMAQMEGQQETERVQQMSGAQQQLAQLGANLKQIEDQKKVTDLQTGLQNQQISNEQRLSEMDLSAKQEMFDSRMKFAEDELGRKFSNERQLADWKRMTARSQEELKDYEQKMGQLSQKSQYMSKVALEKVTEEMQISNSMIQQLETQANNVALSEAERTNARDILQKKLAQKLRLEKAAVELQKSIARKQAEEASRKVRNGAILGTAGAAVGAYFGGPMGATAGYSIGSGIGSNLSI